MEYRKLGRTGVDVGVIGLGAQRLDGADLKTISSVINEAHDYGVNYIDLNRPTPTYRDNFGIALKDLRHKFIITGHLGFAMKDNQCFRTFNSRISEEYIHDLLKRLHTDYIDVLMLHFVDTDEDYKKVFKAGGLLQTALRMKQEGLARFIGLSSHRVPVALRAINSGYIDVLMFPVNPLFDTMPGDTKLVDLWKEKSYSAEPANAAPVVLERRELYDACERNGVGIIAMKSYAASWLFDRANPGSVVMSPVQCLSYSLSKPGVSAVVPGCKTLKELQAALKYLTASPDEKDFSIINSGTRWNRRQICLYCNHCLPCPSGIDIAAITRLTDAARLGITSNILEKYKNLSAHASECSACGACIKSCPFDVDVVSNMRFAVELLGS